MLKPDTNCSSSDTSPKVSFIFDLAGEFLGVCTNPPSTPRPLPEISNILSTRLIEEKWREQIKQSMEEGSPLKLDPHTISPAHLGLNGKTRISGYKACPIHKPDGSPGGILLEARFSRAAQAPPKKAISSVPAQLPFLSKNSGEAFIYSISHDLRSPLLTIEGMIDMVIADDENVFSEKSQTMLSRVKHNSEKIASMINDLLDLSRVGRFYCRHEILDPIIIARQVSSCLEARNKYGRIQTTFEGENVKVVFSRKRLAQILRNLMDNAIKALETVCGGVIRIRIAPQNGFAHLTVTDNGIGIKEDYLEEIYLPFRRLADFRTKPGNGMGLTLVKTIMDKSSGKVWIESHPGEGTTVHLHLPLAE